MFNVTRRDMGEFVFFMSQPVAILLEDLVQWIYKQSSTQPYSGTARFAGYIWVFLWFSITLPYYVKGCRDAGIMQDFIVGNETLDRVVQFVTSSLLPASEKLHHG